MGLRRPGALILGFLCCIVVWWHHRNSRHRLHGRKHSLIQDSGPVVTPKTVHPSVSSTAFKPASSRSFRPAAPDETVATSSASAGVPRATSPEAPLAFPSEIPHPAPLAAPSAVLTKPLDPLPSGSPILSPLAPPPLARTPPVTPPHNALVFKGVFHTPRRRDPLFDTTFDPFPEKCPNYAAGNASPAMCWGLCFQYPLFALRNPPHDKGSCRCGTALSRFAHPGASPAANPHPTPPWRVFSNRCADTAPCAPPPSHFTHHPQPHYSRFNITDSRYAPRPLMPALKRDYLEPTTSYAFINVSALGATSDAEPLFSPSEAHRLLSLEQGLSNLVRVVEAHTVPLANLTPGCVWKHQQPQQPHARLCLTPDLLALPSQNVSLEAFVNLVDPPAGTAARHTHTFRYGALCDVDLMADVVGLGDLRRNRSVVCVSFAEQDCVYQFCAGVPALRVHVFVVATGDVRNGGRPMPTACFASPKILKVFVVNFSRQEQQLLAPKFLGVPLGPPQPGWPPGSTGNELGDWRRSAEARRPVRHRHSRVHAAFSSFGWGRSGWRKHIIPAVLRNGLTAQTAEAGTADVRAYLQRISQCLWVLAPPGSGADTFRFWEALALGRVPVVLAEVLPRALVEDLPVLEVRDYGDLNASALGEAWHRLSAGTYNVHKTLPWYWYMYILLHALHTP